MEVRHILLPCTLCLRRRKKQKLKTSRMTNFIYDIEVNEATSVGNKGSPN